MPPQIDITDATSDARQDTLPPRWKVLEQAIEWWRICELEHDSVNPDRLGAFAVDSDEAGYQGWRICENCESIKEDFEDWLARREAKP